MEGKAKMNTFLTKVMSAIILVIYLMGQYSGHKTISADFAAMMMIYTYIMLKKDSDK